MERFAKMALFTGVVAGSVGCGGAAPAVASSNQGEGEHGGAHDIDWDNRTYVETFEDSEPKTYVVTGGFSGNTPGADPDVPEIMVQTPAFGDVDGDGLDDVVLRITEIVFGRSVVDWLWVYTVAGDAPRLMGRIEGGDHGDGGIANVAIRGGDVWVERNGTTGAACCAEYIDLERWRWDGTAFVEDEAARSRRDLPAEDEDDTTDDEAGDGASDEP